MPPYFSDGMVLQTNTQYGARAFLNGWASPGEEISVDAPRGPYNVKAGADGRWRVQLSPEKKGTSATITVKGRGNSVVARDVRYGDVFLCSGQSNMGKPLSYDLNATAEIAAAGNYSRKSGTMCDRCWCRKCTWNVFGSLGSRAARPTPSARSALGAGLAARDPRSRCSQRPQRPPMAWPGHPWPSHIVLDFLLTVLPERC